MPDSLHTGVNLQLVYLARLREAFGRSGERLTLPSGATVAGLLDALRARGEPWSRELAPGRAFRVAVNHDIASAGASLRDGDEVAILPPVTGG
ncbi:MAG: MoaD/ThiS family protein [Burkholderiales bacterium]